jgi:hypothetical protein
LGRRTLLRRGGIFDNNVGIGLDGGLELMRKAYVEEFNFSERSFPKQMEARGSFFFILTCNSIDKGFRIL